MCVKILIIITPLHVYVGLSFVLINISYAKTLVGNRILLGLVRPGGPGPKLGPWRSPPFKGEGPSPLLYTLMIYKKGGKGWPGRLPTLHTFLPGPGSRQKCMRGWTSKPTSATFPYTINVYEWGVTSPLIYICYLGGWLESQI